MVKPALNLPDQVYSLIKLALEEDIGPAGDITTNSCIPKAQLGQSTIYAKEELVLSGVDIAIAVFQMIDESIDFKILKNDADHLQPGDAVAKLTGHLHSILAGERTALNFLCHLSGVATLTAKFVSASSLKVEITDTRKTTPGLRYLEKMAVRAGGGTNHRMGLFNDILIKDNHVDICGGVIQAVRYAAIANPNGIIEVEVRNLAELAQAVEAGAHTALCDHFSIDELTQAVQKFGNTIQLEASGNISLENVNAIAATGVHRISIGALTHSAPAADLNMKIIGL